jgi:hypothetical protein
VEVVEVVVNVVVDVEVVVFVEVLVEEIDVVAELGFNPFIVTVASSDIRPE